MALVCTQATPSADLSQADIEALTVRTQDGGTEVVQAKAGKVRGISLLNRRRSKSTQC